MGRWDKPYRLYWSNVEMYQECPQKFLWYRGWKDIDLGAGPGKKKPIPERQSEHHALMGSVIAKVFERLYNDELWREPKTLKQTLIEITEKEFEREFRERYIVWRKNDHDKVWFRSPMKAELLQTCIDGITGYLKTLKHNKIIGTYARSEVDLSTSIDKNVRIGGRADLITRRDDTGVSLYDGKNSGTVGRYTSPKQLMWYALCFYQAYRKLPDNLYFIYFRYPYGTPKEEIRGNLPEGEWTGLVHVPFTMDDLKELAQDAKKVYWAMQKKKFAPTPSPSVCKFCEYESVCDARKSQRQANAAKRKRKPKAVDVKVTKAADNGGFVDLGFGKK